MSKGLPTQSKKEVVTVSSSQLTVTSLLQGTNDQIAFITEFKNAVLETNWPQVYTDTAIASRNGLAEEAYAQFLTNQDLKFGKVVAMQPLAITNGSSLQNTKSFSFLTQERIMDADSTMHQEKRTYVIIWESGQWKYAKTIMQ